MRLIVISSECSVDVIEQVKGFIVPFISNALKHPINIHSLKQRRHNRTTLNKQTVAFYYIALHIIHFLQ